MQTRPTEHVLAPEGRVLFVAAGFEDRCFGHLLACEEKGLHYGSVVVVEYEPFNEKNRIEELCAVASRVSASGVAHRVRFSRYEPGASQDCSQEALDAHLLSRQGVLDISGMSRFLIIILTVRLARLGRLSHVVYSEPVEYTPKREDFEKQRVHDDGTISTLWCQTTGLHGLTAVPDLTTATMQGCPELLIASPTFDPTFMRALLTEVSPAKLVLLEGVPAASELSWRQKAVRQMNQFAFSMANEVVEIKTDAVDEASDQIRRICAEHKYSHRVVLAPAASKLNAVGEALAVAGGVEVEVLYPTPIGFSDPYTVGVKRTLVRECVP